MEFGGIAELLRIARSRQKVLHIAYRPANEGRLVERDIEVYGFDGKYVDAYCRLRQDPRCFRIDRIHRASLKPESFKVQSEIESIIAAHGWVNRSAAWRKERMDSVLADKVCDKLLDRL
jgi:predicted DNA-binding transcriptional regulator YafY